MALDRRRPFQEVCGGNYPYRYIQDGVLFEANGMILPAERLLPDPSAVPPSQIGPHALEEMCELARAAPEGCFVEFGVYQGGSAWHLAQIARGQGRELYLYDTFTGIPYKGEYDSHKVGDFADTSLEQVKAAIPDAHYGVGVFPGSILPMPPIAFAHIDADQYQSIKAAIEYLAPLVVEGGRMLFDDYECLKGADLAIAEWGEPLEKTGSGKAVWTRPSEAPMLSEVMAPKRRARK